MSHVTCLCGHKIDTRHVPSENVYLGISDAWFNLISNRLENSADLSKSELLDALAFDLFGYRGNRHFFLYPCRECGRVSLEAHGFRLVLSAESGDVMAWIRDMDLDMAEFRALQEGD